MSHGFGHSGTAPEEPRAIGACSSTRMFALERSRGAALTVFAMIAATAACTPAGVHADVIELQAPTSAYCARLPTANGGDADLRATVQEFPGATCGQYQARCATPGVDPKDYYVAIVPASGQVRGTVLSIGGYQGESFHSENVADYAAGGFRVLMLAAAGTAADAAFCARTGCPRYVSANEPGPKEAMCRLAQLIEYFKQRYDADGTQGYCAQGHSSGSSAIAYTLSHYGSGALLDYVQLTAFTPLARPDYGCDPARYNLRGTRNYAGINPSGRLQRVHNRLYYYDATAPAARELMDQIFGLPADTCGAHPVPGVSPTQLGRLADEGIASSDADYSFPVTVVDAFACLSDDSITDGNGAWWLQSAQAMNPGRVFMQALYQGGGNVQQCEHEEVWWRSDGEQSPLRPLTIERMLSQCLPR